eukprot:5134060-Amphidinium_carterae.1
MVTFRLEEPIRGHLMTTKQLALRIQSIQQTLCVHFLSYHCGLEGVEATAHTDMYRQARTLKSYAFAMKSTNAKTDNVMPKGSIVTVHTIRLGLRMY